MKRGIVQSRGLGDIIIALPIARFYHEQGEEIVWPICREFLDSVQDYAPWVKWIPIDTDPQGRFFLHTPLQALQAEGCDLTEMLYLYQYLNSNPELTDPELFNILKFDQYKYQVAGVPFTHKWRLRDCIERNPIREDQLRSVVLPVDGQRYCVAHLKGSSAQVDQNIARNFIDPAVRIINVDDYSYTSVFDWIPIIEGAESLVCLDSVFANMTDQWDIQGPERYWIRRSPWDLTPVLGGHWIVVPTNLPVQEPKRVDPQAEALKKTQMLQSQSGREQGAIHSHVPFQTDKSKIPTNFMHALKK